MGIFTESAKKWDMMLDREDISTVFSRLKGMLFDLDGTLIDSFETIYDAVNVAMERLGLPPIPPEDIRPTIGVPLKEVLGTHIESDLVDKAISIYRARQMETLLSCTRVMPGAEEVLSELTSRGVLCGVVTNKPTRMAKIVLEHFALDRYLDVIVGLDNVERPKPDPEGLLWAISRFGLSAQECGYVGDSVIDMMTGKAAGTLVMAVATGASREVDLRLAGADAVFRDLEEMAVCLRKARRGEKVLTCENGRATVTARVASDLPRDVESLPYDEEDRVAEGDARTLVLLVRHGETEHNRDRRFQGWSADSSLTEVGTEGACTVASLLPRFAAKISALYSSDLERALKTARPISRTLGLPVLPEPRFREMNFGAWEGLSREEVATIDPEAYRLWIAGSPDAKPRDGESFREMSERVLCGLSDLARRHRGQGIVVVTHLGPLRAIVCAARGWDYGRRNEISTPNCAIVAMEVSVVSDAPRRDLEEGDCPTVRIKEVGEMKVC